MRPRLLLSLTVSGTLLVGGAATAQSGANELPDIPGALLKIERSSNPEARRLAQELRSGAQGLPALRAAARAEGLLKSPQALQRPVPPDAENAAVEYGQLATLLAAHPVPADQANKISALSADSPAEAFSEVRAILQEHREVLDLVHRATDKPDCVFRRDWSKGITLTFAEFAAMREGARELRAQATLLAKDGHLADALLEQRRGFVLARHAGSDPDMISTLVSDAIYHIALDGMEALLQLGGDNATFDDAVRQTIATNPLKTDLRRVLVGELSTADIYLEQFRRGGPGSVLIGADGETVYPGLAIPPQPKARSVTPAEQRVWSEFIEANEADVIRALRSVIGAAGKPYAQRVEVEESVRIPGLPADPTHMFRWAMYRQIGDMDMAGVRLQAASDAVIAGAAVLAFRARHHAYPDMLRQAISPEPADPFAGEPLKYRQEPAGFVVWSVGPNHDFDGGRPGARKPTGQTLFRFPVVRAAAS